MAAGEHPGKKSVINDRDTGGPVRAWAYNDQRLLPHFSTWASEQSLSVSPADGELDFLFPVGPAV